MISHNYIINNSIVVKPTSNEIIINLSIGNDTKVLKLEPRIMNVLNTLAHNTGQVLERDTLIDSIWGNKFVGEDALTQAISRLRKIMGDNVESPKIIETIPKKGYRFVGEIKTQNILEKTEPKTLKNKRSFKRTALFIVPITLFFSLVFIISISIERNQLPVLSPGSTQFTSDKGRENHPAISPNNNYVVFSKRGPNDTVMNLYVKSLHDNNTRRLTESLSDDMNAAWSPDGQFIAYMKLINGFSNIYILPFNNADIKNPGQKILRTNFMNSTHLSWSPDGKLLLFSDKADLNKNLKLFTVNIETRVKTEITERFKDNYNYQNATFSPDGKQIIYSKRLNLNDKIYKLSIDKNPIKEELVLNFNGYVNDIEWYNDQRIIFIGNKENQSSLWHISLDNSKISWLGGEQINSFSYLPKFNTLVYSNRTYNVDLHQVNLTEEKTNKPQIVFSSTKTEWAPDISPDNTSLIFLSNRTGSYQLWLAELTSGFVKQLTFFNDQIIGLAKWSPDGSKITFELLQGDNHSLHLIDPLGGKPTILLKDNFDNKNFSWSKNGKNIYFQSNRTGQKEIWLINLQSKDLEQITTMGALYGEESKDQKYLYFTRLGGESGLWKLTLKNRDNFTKVFNFPNSSDFNIWQLSDSGFYYKNPSYRSFFISHFSFESGETETIFTIGRDLIGSTILFTISQDKSILFYTRLVNLESDLVLTSLK